MLTTKDTIVAAVERKGHFKGYWYHESNTPKLKCKFFLRIRRGNPVPILIL